ncbi:SufS family cysteine desulfurase [Alloscardovia omnicolens]|uniref:SufS family cysteine desulfurase n=1 Tax=Alloscardovia omnicolens TaxID=419015 RepID=UPI00254B2CF7|nr:SufS family cysteine desulfurase [Alloscardovia omnicolens]MDK6248991.1 SufS family cysteine desulfurase [Alloscardovia omnicolens]MDK8073243.1 SufS family cysteine desulfurase [Alloscardovia omnicolens]
MSFNSNTIRSQFPLLTQKVHGYPLVYLDSGATSQKPQAVINAESAFYSTINAGVHRGAHELASLSTDAYENGRYAVARLIGAHYGEGSDEIVVTGGATAGLNMLANAFDHASHDGIEPFAVGPSDSIVTSRAEHHSVLLPFQELARRTGARLDFFDLDDSGRIVTTSESLARVITERTKIVAVTHISNVTGATTDIPAIVRRAHEVGAIVVLDACQSVPHLPIDVHELDVDFAAFSAHKMYGPTGVGFLYGKREMLEKLPPMNFGGSMVELAWLDKPAQYMAPPAKFEAGTQPVAQVVASGVAANWMMDLGMENLAAHEHELVEHLMQIQDIDHVRILGPTDTTDRIGTVAFEIDDVHPHDVGQFIDSRGIAIRVGHHCAQPIHRHFGVYASNRVSLGVYNTHEDIDRLLEAVAEVYGFFHR